MADQKVSNLPSLNGADVDAADLLYIIDSSAGSAGSKKITVGQYQLAPVSGGTANGVAYLDASKVLTTGSGLVFDGTNLGLGVTPSSWISNAKAIQVGSFLSAWTGSNGSANLSFGAYEGGTVNTYRYLTTGDAPTLYQQLTGKHAWFTAPSGTAGNAISFTQAMTLDASGNLLVGKTTTTFSEKLGVRGAGATSVPTNLTDLSGALVLVESTRGNTAYGAVGYSDAAGGGAAVVFGRGTSYDTQILFCTNPSSTATSGAMTERMRLDSSGNLGIGTSSPNTKLDVAGKAKIDVNTYASGYALTFGAISETARTYQMGMVSGSAFAIYDSTAAAQRVVLDSSGNLGIGTSSPGAKLDVRSGYITSGTDTSTSGTKVLAGYYTAGHLATWGTEYASGGPVMGYGVWPSTSAAGSFVSATTLAVARGAYTILGGNHIWYSGGVQTVAIDSAVSTSEAMRLDSGGNVGIGASSPGNRLYVSGPQATPQIRSTDGNVDAYIAYSFGTGTSAINYFGTGSNHDQVFITNNIERGRFTKGGDFLVGVGTIAAAGGLTSFNNGGTGFSEVNNNNAAATGYVFSSFRRSSVEIGSITQNGTTAVLFNTTSDRRLKDNIVPAPSASDVIDAIEIVSHDWKSAPGEHVTYGVIAQDLHAVAPQAVLQGDDGDEIEKTWGVDYSKLVPMLIKEIQSLRARVAALESA
jgi:hypothetical protein